MKIAQIKIQNILGVSHLEITPGGFTVISGPNGAGKSSVLEAIKSVAGVGHDATLIKKGEEKGQVVLVLDDGTEIKESITTKATTRNIIVDGKPTARPASALSQLFDSLSTNPIQFLTASPKDRARVLLEAMPINIDMERLKAISGIQEIPQAPTPLEVIEEVRRCVFDDRTGTNRAIKTKSATIEQLKSTLPDADQQPEDVTDEQLDAEAEKAQAAYDTENNRINQKLKGIQTEVDQKISDYKAQIEVWQMMIKDLEVKINNETSSFTQIKLRAETQGAINKSNYTNKIDAIKARRRALAANRDAIARAANTREIIARSQQEAKELMLDADKQTKALTDIDAYKAELLASLPIPNLEIRGGEIYRDGIPFDRLNTAQRVAIAFDVAKLRAGGLKLVCLDGMELLDDAGLEELRKQAEASDMQVFVTRVSNADFSVKTQ